MPEATTQIACPFCKKDTNIRIHHDTVLLNYPLICPHCKQECTIGIVNRKMVVHKD